MLSGEAGQGIKTLEQLIINAINRKGLYFFSTSELMSRIRGGNNTTEIRISNKPVSGFVEKIDVLLLLNKNSMSRLKSRISHKTIIIGEDEFIDEQYAEGDYTLKKIPINQMAKDAGGKILSNTILYGLICSMFDVPAEAEMDFLSDTFKEKGEETVEKNHHAFDAGYQKAKELGLHLPIENQYSEERERTIFSGTKSIGVGALCGGCNFISSYPMSPSTGVLQFLWDNAEEFGVVVEQAEDEISAINMVQGAWYAGGRAMVTTSGGGFALMEEGLSLSGITETPVVIHLAQRPGPGTGLPTRTEQGDLNLALYAGHGDFPRLIFAPGNPVDAIDLMNKAFNMADRFQIPVIVLTDQFFLNAYQNIQKPDLSNLKTTKYIHKTQKDYHRYKLTANGVSPRGIPNLGEGLVCVDSDEHDTDGRITESFEVRKKMVEKRLKKLDALKNEAIKPEIFGDEDYKTLIIGWGSNYGVIRDCVDEMDKEEVAFAYFKQLYPLHGNTQKILEKAETIISIENNATGQFADLLQNETGIKIKKRILKYNGMPFSKEELIKKTGGIK